MVDGSNDLDGMKRISNASFTFQYEIIRYFKAHILKEKPIKMASWIDVRAREIGLIK
jgi:hypothetical protein